MKRLQTYVLSLMFLSLLTVSSRAQTVYQSKHHSFQLQTILTQLSYPWGMCFLPNGELLITEKSGSLKRLSKNGTKLSLISGVPKNLKVIGQGGLLDVVLDPQFSQNGWLYLSYSGSGKGGVSTEVVRARLQGSRLTEMRTIFVQKPKLSGGYHFGSRLAFMPDGTLLISMGDRGRMKMAQNPLNHVGTIVRIHPDGRIPKTNPFYGKPQLALESVYTYGNRNVQGLAIRPKDGAVWAHEHGPKGGDELNRIRPGVNYGWPSITYGINYNGRPISTATRAPGMPLPDKLISTIHTGDSRI